MQYLVPRGDESGFPSTLTPYPPVIELNVPQHDAALLDQLISFLLDFKRHLMTH
jgi:hypothetical protein